MRLTPVRRWTGLAATLEMAERARHPSGMMENRMMVLREVK